MKTINHIKARAVQLREELTGVDITVSHSESLELVSKVEGYSDWNTHTADLAKRQEIAEKYMDEILEAEKEVDYEKFIQRFEKKYIPGFTEKNFNRQMKYIHEEMGAYLRREHLGTTKGEVESDIRERYPDVTKHVWRAVYEKAEMFLTAGVYVKNGVYHLSSVNSRNM